MKKDATDGACSMHGDGEIKLNYWVYNHECKGKLGTSTHWGDDNIKMSLRETE